MSMINDCGPAFPSGDNSAFGPHAGMSLRHWYAGQAMAALITKANFIDREGQHGVGMTQADIDEFRKDIAVSAREYADAMITALAPEPQS